LAISVATIKSYMDNDLNIIVSGLAGTGKTSILTEASRQLGLNMQYYSAATLDPYTDLVGIPVPNHETKSVEYFRPKAIDEAEVVFFDEANRADPKTLNTLFELIQFRSINGEKLPKLKCVVAAINPNDGKYTVDDLDPALLDRFDMFLTAEPGIDYGYFSKLFGPAMAKEASTWWREYHNSYKASLSSQKPQVYISPRRMEKIISSYIKIPAQSTVVASLPIGATVGVDALTRRLKVALGDSVASSENVSEVDRILNLSVSDLRSMKNARAIKHVVVANEDKDKVNRLLNQLAAALSNNVGPQRIVENWGEVVSKMTYTQTSVMTSGWTVYKIRDLAEAMKTAGFVLNR
jgi:hypothetical protein